jgi:Peptidase A4 family
MLPGSGDRRQWPALEQEFSKQEDVMKNVMIMLVNRQPGAAPQENACCRMAWAALLLCCFAASMVAQAVPRMEVAAEMGFTVAPDVSTPIVLKTQPDAVCDLHGEDAGEEMKTMKFYSNGDGYVKVHVRVTEESQEARAQLDCANANGSVTRYPLHLRASSSPTSDMPSPPSVMPVAKGSRVQPALTKAEAQQLSDEELTSRGYPPRPDSPDAYASWLEVVTRAGIRVDAHPVSRSDISHHLVQAGVTDDSNWSGYVSDAPKNRTYSSVHGEWHVPELTSCESGESTYSAFWIGLDGYFLSELSQEGTEQDCYYIGTSYYTNYYAWEELLPNQPSEEQITGLAPNPGDIIYSTLWIGNSSGVRTNNGSGCCVWFYLNDETQGVYAQFDVALGRTHFDGKTVEWIMERPGFGGSLTQLSDYNYARMLNAQGFTTKGKWFDYSALGNLVQLWLYNEFVNDPDDNLLSIADDDGASTIYYQWSDFH